MIDKREYLFPLWKAKRVVNETFMFLGEEDSAPFLYNPQKVEYVKNYSLDTEYEEGRDYVIENASIRRLKDSRIPFFTVDEYYTTDSGQVSIGVNAEVVPYKFSQQRYLVYGESDIFTKKQIAVTYTHGDEWAGKVPVCKKHKLPKTHKKLQNGEHLTITFYGDSIMTGCNSSGTQQGGNIPPYMPAFPDLITEFLRESMGACITLHNVSQGGWNTREGLDAFNERVTPTVPDLLILGFGMNDLTTPLNEYKDMIEEMVRRLRDVNPEAEVIAVATMWPHVESTWVLNQIHTLGKLTELEQKYPFFAVADMTTFHKDVMNAGKRYRDMTGNNINHPNDFIARAYAQVILTTLIGDDYL